MTKTRSSEVDQQQISERVEEILNQAVESDTPEMKNYHIRRALQYRVISDYHK